jgi:DNA polymerase-1
MDSIHPKGYADLIGYLVDIDEFKKNMELPNYPPRPSMFSKEALSQREGMEWLSGVETELFYPESESEDAQRARLQSFRAKLRDEAIILPAGFCSSFPKDYNERLLCLDLETNSLDTRVIYNKKGEITPKVRIVAICLATSSDKGYYLPVRHTEDDGIPNWSKKVIIEFLSQLHQEFTLIYHHSQYDMVVEALNGVSGFRGWPYIIDTILLDFAHDVNRKVHGLKPISAMLLGRKMIEFKDIFNLIEGEHGEVKKRKKKSSVLDMERLPATSACVYGCCDAMNTFGVLQYYASMEESENVFTVQPIPLSVDHKMVPCLKTLYSPGMPVSFDYCLSAAKDSYMRMKMLEQAMYEFVGKEFDIGSPHQLSRILFDESNIPTLPDMTRGKATKSAPKGNYTTREEVLDKLYEKYPEFTILHFIVYYRKLKNANSRLFLKLLLNSYIDALIPFTRVQLAYSQTVIPTGRLSSSSSESKERVAVKEGKNGLIYTYHKGAWTAGMNSQGIVRSKYKLFPAKKIKAIPEAAGINLEKVYPQWVVEGFVKEAACLKK